MNNAQLEQDILEAARTCDPTLDHLLRTAYETMEEAEFNRVYDKAHQILTEGLREARGWRDDDETVS